MSDAPTSIRLLREQRQLEIGWPDGPISRFPLKFLRCECPCASCVNEFTGKRMINPEDIAEDVHPVNIQFSGNYALKITWSDGHDSGIYSWDRLRELSDELLG